MNTVILTAILSAGNSEFIQRITCSGSPRISTEHTSSSSSSGRTGGKRGSLVPALIAFMMISLATIVLSWCDRTDTATQLAVLLKGKRRHRLVRDNNAGSAVCALGTVARIYCFKVFMARFTYGSLLSSFNWYLSFPVLPLHINSRRQTVLHGKRLSFVWDVCQCTSIMTNERSPHSAA